jgi:hypothetical protein
MAKKPPGKAIEAAPLQDAEPSTVFVTYLPDDGDFDQTAVNGITFMADEPVELDATNPTHGTVLARIQGNPFFHVGDDPPPSRKSVAVRGRAADVIDKLEHIVARFRDGTVTHYDATELERIASKIKESKR